MTDVAVATLPQVARRPRTRAAAGRHWAGLTWMLARKNFRQRYLRMRLGVVWALVQPTVQALLLALVFVRIFNIHHVPNYPLYVLSGIMTWQLFSSGTTSAMGSAVDNAALIRKIPLPTVVFPLSAVGGVLIVHALQLAVLVGLAVAVGTAGVKLLLLPLGVVLGALLALGVGTLACALHVRMRDVRFLVESGLMVLFYVTPVLYDPAKLPPYITSILQWNPMYAVLSLQRAALLDRAVDWPAVGIGAVVAVAVLLVALPVYQRRSQEFVDLL